MTLLIRMCVSVYWIDTEGADLVWPIVQQGMNERFAGASAGTAFGDVKCLLYSYVLSFVRLCVCIAICTIQDGCDGGLGAATDEI
jgi:hypothetical protein